MKDEIVYPLCALHPVGSGLHRGVRAVGRAEVVHTAQESPPPRGRENEGHAPPTLIHYCDAGNRPRMVAKPSADGKTVDFEFLDVTGNLKFGHMHHAAFTPVDADHHIEDWTFMVGADKHVNAHVELHRVK